MSASCDSWERVLCSGGRGTQVGDARLRSRASTLGRVPEPNAIPDPEQQEGEARPLPVLAEPRAIERPREASLPAAVVAATGGFLIGAATFVLVRLLRRPRAAASLRLGRRKGRGKRVEIASSRSFLVDVHLLKDR
jgi:hypothetical protein